jgi:hypothetical protein
MRTRVWNYRHLIASNLFRNETIPRANRSQDARDRRRGPMIFTLGHSTRRLDAFIRLLQAHGVDMILDVRKMPGSRQNPQFNIDTLPAALAQAAIGYHHLPALGGLRRADTADPTNAGWRNRSFRAYADYMQTDAFKTGLDECIGLAKDRRAALMCAEAVPWRCHRSLIADALLVRGFAVFEITSAATARPLHLTPFANVSGSDITYPADSTSLLLTDMSR